MNKTRVCHAFAFLLLGFFFPSASPPDVSAQVVISAGVTETYDDNIFLEQDEQLGPIRLPSGQPGGPDSIIELPEELDGEKNDDFITDVRFGLSGAPSLIRGVQSVAGATVGGIFFADQSDFDRMTLNSTVSLHSLEELIPRPFFINLDSNIRSQSNDATVAQGTATRLTQVHYANLDAGVRNVALNPKLSWGAAYRLGYVDFLGDFSFKDPEDVPGRVENQLDNRGSDYLTNGVTTSFDQQVSQRLLVSAGAAFNVISFTDVNSNTGFEQDRGQLDRNEFVPSLQARYQLSKDFTLDGSAGYNFTQYSEDGEPISTVIIDDNGNPVQVTAQRSDRQDSFIFGAGIGYAPDAANSLHLGANQSTTPDVNGNRLITRSVNVIGVQTLTDRLRGTASGRFLQFDVGDSLQNASERFEFTLALHYSITPSVALNTGWMYADQKEDENGDEGFLASVNDYQANRFFIGLSAGFVGLLH